MSEAYTDWKHWDAERFGHCPRSEARYFDWCVKRADLPSAPGRVLEVGFGNGSFLGYCQDRGWSVSGVETNTTLLARAAAAGFPAYADLAQLPGDCAFDLVAAFDVLEHVPFAQAIAMLARLRALLTPGGAILLRVPNGDSPFGRSYQHGDHTHVETYGSEKLRQLCASLQLSLAHPGDPPWHAQQGQPRTLRTFLRSLLKRSLDRLFGYAYFGYYLDLSPNLFVIIKPRREIRA